MYRLIFGQVPYAEAAMRTYTKCVLEKSRKGSGAKCPLFLRVEKVSPVVNVSPLVAVSECTRL